MAQKLFSTLNNYFVDKGSVYLVVITAIEFIFYIAYTVIYYVNRSEEGVTDIQAYKWALTFVLLASIAYFLWHSLMNKTLMELISYAIMLVLTNIIFLVREIVMILDLKDQQNKNALQLTEYIMSAAGLGGSVIATVFILLILKPVYKNMQEDVFLKIGGNGNMWEVYKYFTLCKSFLKLDFIICVEFMITSFFYWYVTGHNYYMLGAEVVVSLLIIANSFHGHYMINNKMHQQFAFFFILRLLIELEKIYRTVTCVLGYDLKFQHFDILKEDEEFQQAMVVFEVVGVGAMLLSVGSMKKIISTFNRNEFDLIRNDFTQDFYKVQRDDTNE